jgi:alpha-tubulin suppressor-like RCC1 family protein
MGKLQPGLCPVVFQSTSALLLGNLICALLATTGHAFAAGWGRSVEGQLGSVPNPEVWYDPQVAGQAGPLAGQNISLFAVGQGTIVQSNQHVVAVTASNRIFAWGHSRYGLMGSQSH